MGEMKIEELSYLSEKTILRLQSKKINTVQQLVEAYRTKGTSGLARYTDIPRATLDPIKRKMEEFFLPTKSDLEKKQGYKLLSQQEVSLMTGIPFKDIEGSIQSGLIPKSAYIVAGKDFEPSKISVKYLFIESEIENLLRKYDSTLPEVKDALNIEGLTVNTLHKQLTNKLTEEEWLEVKLTRYRWNKKWVLDNYYELLERKKVQKEIKADYVEYLDNEIVISLDAYIQHRLNYDFISFDGVDYVKTKFTKDNSAKEQKKIIQRALYRVKCHRAGIVGFDEYDKSTLMLRQLNPEEREKVLKLKFDVRSFTKEDMKAVISGMGNGSFNYRRALLPFLYFILMKEEEKYNELLERSLSDPSITFNAQDEWTKLKLMKVRFESALKELPKKPPKVKKENKKLKVFARRDQVVKMFQGVITNRPGTLQDQTKYAAQLLIGFMAGIRPVEMWQMKINEHLDIEKEPTHPEFGLMKKYKIKLNKDGEAYFERTSVNDLEGWGRIFISEEISKGNYSPSPHYGTLAVPILVEVINNYLRMLYKKTASDRIGTGYLFRGSSYNPDVPYASPKGLFRWIFRIRDTFDFLTEEQMKNFTFYETRHTVNNLIVNRTWIDNPKMNEWKLRVAETHSRHSIQETDDSFIQARGKVNEEHYQDVVPLWMYYNVIDAALNFPFEKNALKEYEKQYNPVASDLDAFEDDSNGYVLAEKTNIQKEKTVDKELSAEEREILLEIEKNLTELESYLSMLRIPSKAKKQGISGSQRREQIEETNRKITDLERRKREIITGE